MHTPGPWTFDPSAEADGRRSGYIRGPKSNGAGGLIAVARVTEAGNGHSERMANARLIASAPRLLAALEDALRYISLCEMEEVVPTTTGIGYGEAAAAVAAATMEGHQ